MKDLHVLGVTHVNDSYPNVKYKLVALEQLLGDNYSEFVVPLSKADASPGIFAAMSSSRPVFIWRLLIAHIKVLFHSLRHRAKSVYVCYPGVLLAIWLGLPFMRRRYPTMYLDAFISLYDTIVCDRSLLKENSYLAKLLFRLEKRAFAAATLVIVDTPENAQYFSQLFDIPLDRFYAMPLSIPPLLSSAKKVEKKHSGLMRCVFLGTFVPLQGIRTIVAVAKLLATDSKIEFVFVGDGQDANFLQDFMAKNPDSNVTWHRGHFSTEFVVEQIVGADICLGIFGDGPKAQRVLPYKIYYYLALGMPVITAATVTTRRILAERGDHNDDAPLLLVPPGDEQSLADALRRLHDNPAEYTRTGRAGANYYKSALSESAIRQSLRTIIDVS